MSPMPESPTPPAPVARLARAQARIRALTSRARLTPAERLELAAWQREWVAARREGDAPPPVARPAQLVGNAPAGPAE